MESAGKLLVVDDYVPNANGMRDLLSAAGYSVRVANNGADALQLVAEEAPDLVLVDVVMPGMSGVELCRELKTREGTRLTPVVLITASQDRGHRIDGLEAGADDFLGKPIDIQELRTRVRSLLRVKQLTDELESTEAIMTMLGHIVEARDPYTEGHCQRLAEYATALGTALRLDRVGSRYPESRRGAARRRKDRAARHRVVEARPPGSRRACADAGASGRRGQFVSNCPIVGAGAADRSLASRAAGRPGISGPFIWR